MIQAAPCPQDAAAALTPLREALAQQDAMLVAQRLKASPLALNCVARRHAEPKPDLGTSLAEAHDSGRTRKLDANCAGARDLTAEIGHATGDRGVPGPAWPRSHRTYRPVSSQLEAWLADWCRAVEAAA